jgi:hypothetical protein
LLAPAKSAIQNPQFFIFHPDSYRIGVNLSKIENNVFCSFAKKIKKKEILEIVLYYRQL